MSTPSSDASRHPEFQAFLAQPGLKYDHTDENAAALILYVRLHNLKLDVIGLNAANQIRIALKNERTRRAQVGQ